MRTINITICSLFLGLLGFASISQAAVTDCSANPDTQCIAQLDINVTLQPLVEISNLKDIHVDRDAWKTDQFYSQPVSFCVYSNDPSGNYDITFTGANSKIADPRGAGRSFRTVNQTTPDVNNGFNYAVNFYNTPAAVAQDCTKNPNCSRAQYGVAIPGSNAAPTAGCPSGNNVSFILDFSYFGDHFPTDGMYTDTLNVLVTPPT